MRSELARARKAHAKYRTKRKAVIEWLRHRGHKISDAPGRSDRSVFELAHDELGKPQIEEFYNDNQYLAAMYSRIIQWALQRERDNGNLNLPGQKGTQTKSKIRRKKLKSGTKWKRIRYAVFKRDGNHCSCCGRSPKDGFVMHIDHIKPLSKHWDLRFDMGNLQVLCSECNSMKACEETDWC